MTDHEYNYRVPWGISGQRQLSDVRCMSCAIAEDQKVDGERYASDTRRGGIGK